ncbi:MAG: IS3 family transposase, partial [Atopobium sp.]|nr:IS3 family transposase [Atopobium sp.]
MTQRRKRYDRQFKVAAAKVVLVGETTVIDLFRELGVKDATLRRWAKEYEEMREDAFFGNGSPKVNKDYEIVKLKKTGRGTRAGKRTVKKFPGLRKSRPHVRYRFLKKHRDDLGPIKKAYDLMRVSKSGYYKYLGRRKSNQQIEREALEGFVEDIFFKHKDRYKHRRINLELRKSGVVVSEKRVVRIMREKGLQAKAITR